MLGCARSTTVFVSLWGCPSNIDQTVTSNLNAEPVCLRYAYYFCFAAHHILAFHLHSVRVGMLGLRPVSDVNTKEEASWESGTATERISDTNWIVKIQDFSFSERFQTVLITDKQHTASTIWFSTDI